MIIVNWMNQFWNLIGLGYSTLKHHFNHMICPNGFGVYDRPGPEFQVAKVWFTCANPRNVVGDWSAINLVRVRGNPETRGVNVLADVKAETCKVSWFIHG